MAQKKFFRRVGHLGTACVFLASREAHPFQDSSIELVQTNRTSHLKRILPEYFKRYEGLKMRFSSEAQSAPLSGIQNSPVCRAMTRYIFSHDKQHTYACWRNFARNIPFKVQKKTDNQPDGFLTTFVSSPFSRQTLREGQRQRRRHKGCQEDFAFLGRRREDSQDVPGELLQGTSRARTTDGGFRKRRSCLVCRLLAASFQGRDSWDEVYQD